MNTLHKCQATIKKHIIIFKYKYETYKLLRKKYVRNREHNQCILLNTITPEFH